MKKMMIDKKIYRIGFYADLALLVIHKHEGNKASDPFWRFSSGELRTPLPYNGAVIIQTI